MPDSRSFDVVLADGRRTTVRAVTDGDATAWAAFGDDSRDAVGVARLVVRSPRGSAEVEVAVARAYRERGLGKILFDTLVLTALELGVDRVVARVRADSWIGHIVHVPPVAQVHRSALNSLARPIFINLAILYGPQGRYAPPDAMVERSRSAALLVLAPERSSPSAPSPPVPRAAAPRSSIAIGCPHIPSCPTV
jgi:GNAT superfamily N-acetyltransferase